MFSYYIIFDHYVLFVTVMCVVMWLSVIVCEISPPAPGATHTHADAELPLVEMLEDAEPDLPGQHV